MRTNVKTLFCVLLFLSVFIFSVADLVPPLDVMTTPFSPTPVSASEEENVDSFNVHPANRWTESNEGFTAAIANGRLNMSDTGDGSTDYYYIQRGLSSLDNQIEFSFMFDVKENDSGGATDVMTLLILDSSGSDYFYLANYNVRDKQVAKSQLIYIDTGGTERKLNLTGSERLMDEEWYLFTMDFDFLRNKMDFKLEFFNGTDVWDYDWTDISSAYRPRIFDKEDLMVRIYCRGNQNNKRYCFYVDWVDAPFKEREWVHYNRPSDENFIHDHWAGATVEDDIMTDRSQWRLVVPYFDACSGTMRVHQESDISDYQDRLVYRLSLYGVDGDDGDLHLIGRIEMELQDLNSPGGNALRTWIYIEDGNGGTIWEHSDNEAIDEQAVQFSIGMSEDRTKGIIKARGNLDIENDADWESGNYNFTVSDWVTDPSSEFVIEVDYYIVQFTGNTEIVFSLDTFELVERNIFEDLIFPIVDGLIGVVVGLFGMVFVPLIRFLGDVLRRAIDALGPLITTLQSALDTAIGLVETAVDAVGTAVAAIAQDLLDLIGSFIDDAIAWLLTIISDLVELFAEIVFAIYDGLWEDVLGFSDAPDLIAIVYALGTGFIQLVLGMPGFVTDFAFYVQNTWDMIAWIGVIVFLFVPLLSSSNIGEFFEKVIEYMSKDLTMGFGVFGFHIPIPAGLVWLLLLLIGPLAGTSYAGFLP